MNEYLTVYSIIIKINEIIVFAMCIQDLEDTIQIKEW